MTNLIDALHIPDTQSEHDERKLAIQRVGIRGVRYPLQLRIEGAVLPTVANMRFVKPLDTALVEELARTHEGIVTVEEGSLAGGAGTAVMEALHAAGLKTPVLALGLPDEFVEHGDPGTLLSMLGLDAAGIEQSILKRFGARPALVSGGLRPAANS